MKFIQISWWRTRPCDTNRTPFIILAKNMKGGMLMVAFIAVMIYPLELDTMKTVTKNTKNGMSIMKIIAKETYPLTLNIEKIILFFV
jgi:hypothetical protein